MVKYSRRFIKGVEFFVAKYDGQEIATLNENQGFIGGWDVIRHGKTNHFTTLDAAKNFVENIVTLGVN